jgi:adenylate kinase family enzyme
MKTILILGICRTGKTTFSRMIQKEFRNYQIIEVDTIISALQRTVVNVPIGFIHDNLQENKLPEFLNLLIQKNINKNGKELGYIVNADSILPEDLHKYFDLKNMIVYYFVTEKLSPEQILENCRKFDSDEEWTTRRTDEELLKHFKFYKKIEKTIINDCKKYNIKCIDTSENREIVLNKLLVDLKNELN